MIQLKFSVNGQVLTRTDDVEIVSDAIGQFEAVFTFDEWWDGFATTAQFTKCGKTYDSILNDNTCEIPHEVLQGGGVFYVNVFATEDVNRKTANEVAVKVKPSGYKKDGEHSVKPTPTVYEQLLKKIEEMSQSGGITEITEDTFVYDLEDGIYHIDYTSGATIYYDDSLGDGLQDGLLWVNYSGDFGYYNFIAIGRDTIWDVGTFVGETKQVNGSWVVTYYKPENSNNKTSRVNEYTNNHNYYPTVKLLVDYVQEQLANVGGGSGVDLVTEFEGTDVDYKKNEVYHANIVNGLIAQLVEWIESKQDLLQDGENIKTINGESILGAGDISIGGGSTEEEWVEVLNTTLADDVAYVDMVAPDGKMFKKLHILVTTGNAGLSTASKILVKGSKINGFSGSNGDSLTTTSGTVNTWGYPAFIIEKGALFPITFVTQGTSTGTNSTPVSIGGAGQVHLYNTEPKYINNGPWKLIRIQPQTADVVFKAGVTIYAWGVYEDA